MPVDLVPIIVEELLIDLRSRPITGLDEETIEAMRAAWSNAIIDILVAGRGKTPLEPMRP